MIKQKYKDIIAFHPGYYLTDIIEELRMTQDEFANQSGIAVNTICLLLNGEIPLTEDLAVKISKMLHISVETLLNLQKAYDEKKNKINHMKITKD